MSTKQNSVTLVKKNWPKNSLCVLHLISAHMQRSASGELWRLPLKHTRYRRIQHAADSVMGRESEYSSDSSRGLPQRNVKILDCWMIEKVIRHGKICGHRKLLKSIAITSLSTNLGRVSKSSLDSRRRSKKWDEIVKKSPLADLCEAWAG